MEVASAPLQQLNVYVFVFVDVVVVANIPRALSEQEVLFKWTARFFSGLK